MRGSKCKELKRMIREVMPNLREDLFKGEYKRIKKLYKEAVRAGQLSYKQRRA